MITVGADLRRNIVLFGNVQLKFFSRPLHGLGFPGM